MKVQTHCEDYISLVRGQELYSGGYLGYQERPNRDEEFTENWLGRFARIAEIVDIRLRRRIRGSYGHK
jgi:hypothetical protein